MPTNTKPRCHRCWKSFTTRGRLFLHKAYSCPAPIARVAVKLKQASSSCQPEYDQLREQEYGPRQTELFVLKPKLVYKPELSEEETYDDDASEQKRQEQETSSQELKPIKREEPLRQDQESGHWICVGCERSYEDQLKAIKHVASSKCGSKSQRANKKIKLDPETSRWVCRKCQITYETRRSVAIHAAKCSGPKLIRSRQDVQFDPDANQWVCQKCEKGFEGRRSAGNHAGKCSGIQSYNCLQCGYTTDSKAKHKHHARSATACERVRKRAIKKEKEASKAIVALDSATNKWTCQKCDRIYPNRQAAAKHSSRCNGTVSYNCDTCIYSSKNRQNLIVHVKSSKGCVTKNNHISKELYCCNECPYDTQNKNTLGLHLQRDTACQRMRKKYLKRAGKEVREAKRLAIAMAKEEKARKLAERELAKQNRINAKAMQRAEHYAALVREEDAEGGAKVWSCVRCDKSYPSLTGSVLHSRCCTGPEIYRCSNCTYTTQKKKLIGIHAQSETACDFVLKKNSMMARSAQLLEERNRKRDEKRAEKEAKVKLMQERKRKIDAEHAEKEAKTETIRVKKEANAALEKARKEWTSSLIQQNAETGIWSCVKCQNNFALRSYAVSHISRTSCAGEALSCDSCNFSTYSRETIQHHAKSCCRKQTAAPKRARKELTSIQQNAESGIWSCVKCRKKFVNRDYAVKHISRSSCAGVTLSCDSCLYSTCSRETLQVHTKSGCRKLKNALRPKQYFKSLKEDESGNWMCLQCERTWPKREYARKHAIYSKCSLLTGARFACQKCNFQTNIPRSFRQHTSNKESCLRAQTNRQRRDRIAKAVGHVTASKNTNSSLRCPNCPYSATNERRMQEHRKTGKGCGLWNLRQVVMRELGLSSWPEPPLRLSCPRCRYTTKKSSRMLDHLQSRTACATTIRSQRVTELNGCLTCERCERTFTRPERLLDHIDSKVCRYRGPKMMNI